MNNKEFMDETIINMVKSLVLQKQYHSMEANEFYTQKLIEQALNEMEIRYSRQGDLFIWD